MKKLIESSLSPKWSIVRGQSFFFHIFSWFFTNWTHIKMNVELVTNKWVNWELCWLIFLVDDIVENIKFSQGFVKVWRHDQTCSSFSVNVSESICLSGNGISKTSVGFIFRTIPRLGKKQSCISELISVKLYTNVQWWSCNA